MQLEAYTEEVAKASDPRHLPEERPIPGLKPAVRDFSPCDDGDPADVDAFNQMIRELRKQGPSGNATSDERPAA